MNRILKAGLIVAGVIGLVLVAAAVAVRVFLTPEKARTFIAQQLSTKLHREVKLGSVSVGLFSGLRVTDFAISEKPAFSDGTFVSSDELRVRLSLPPLLARRIVVSDVRLVNPSVRVVRFPDGRFNFSDLSESSGPAAPATPAKPAAPASKTEKGGGFPVVVTGVSLRGGKLAFDDRAPGGRSVTVDPLNASLRNLSLSGTADVDADLGLKTNGVAADVTFAGVVNALKGSARIKKFTVKSGQSALSASGEVSDLTGDAKVNLAATIDRLDLPLVAKLAPAVAEYRPSGFLKGSAKLNGKLDDVVFDTDFDLGAAGFAAPGGFSKPADKKMTVASNGRLQRQSTLVLDRLALTLGALEASASGRVNSVLSSTRTFALSLRTNSFPVSEALARLPNDTIPADVSLGGDAALTVKVDGTADAGDLDLTLDAVGMNIRYGDSFSKPSGTPMSVRAGGRYRMPAAVDLRTLGVTLATMKLAGAATYKSGEKNAAWSASLKSDGFAVGPVAAMAPAAAEYAPTGTATVDVDLKGGTGDTDIKGRFSLRDGGAKYEQSTLTQLATAGTFTADSVSVPSLKGKLNGSDLAMTLAAKNVGTHPVVNSDIVVTELDLEKLLPKTPPPQKTDAGGLFLGVAHAEMADLPMDLAGTLKAARVKHPYFDGRDLDVAWKLTDVTPALDRVSGSAKLRHGKGEIRNLKKLTADSKLARMLFAPLSVIQKLGKATAGAAKIPPLDQFPFSSITGDYTMKDGLMTITAFLLKSSALDASLKGTMQLAGEQVVNAGGAVLISGVEAPFVIKGPLATASPEFNVAKTVENVIKSGAADKYLKQLGLPTFGKPKSEPAPTAPATEPAPASQAQPQQAPAEPANDKKQLEDAAQDLLKGLFKKKK